MGHEQSTNKEEDSGSEYHSENENDNRNRSNQLNPNNERFWNSRGYHKRPDDWKDRVAIKLPRGNDDNRSDQLNPNNRKYWSSRGHGDPKSSTSVVPLSSSNNEFQLDGDIKTGIEIAGLAYGAYRVHNRISQMVEERMERDPSRQRRSSNEEIARDVMDGLEVAVNVGLLAYGGYRLYKKFSEETEDDDEEQ